MLAQLSRITNASSGNLDCVHEKNKENNLCVCVWRWKYGKLRDCQIEEKEGNS